MGRYTAPSGYWYLGPWVLGLRHGVGIEGLTHNQDQVPIAIVSCEIGKRKTFDRFDPDSKSHLNMLRRMCTSVDTAQKRARKAFQLVETLGTKRTALRMRSLLDLGDSKTRVGVEASRNITLMREKFDHDRIYLTGMSSPEERLEKARKHYKSLFNVLSLGVRKPSRTPSNDESSTAAAQIPSGA